MPYPSKPLGPKLLARLIPFLLLIQLMILLPAGTMDFMLAWIYFGTFSLGTLIITFYFMKKDRALIERRLEPGEQVTAQKVIQSLNGLLFLSLLIVPGLDYRYHWSDVPLYVSMIADAVVLLGFVIVFFVFKQNSYTASTIKAYEDQPVISTGLYGAVRHPMYSGALLIILFTPLALGSWWALIGAVLLAIMVGVRAVNEEKVLSRELKGYAEYCGKVRYRMIPGVW